MIRFLILPILFFFQLCANEISLTKEEIDFLNTHPIIKVSNEKNWAPFDFMIGYKPDGYSIDILKLIEKKIGSKFEYIQNKSWNQLFQMFKEKKIDIVHPIIKREERKKFGNFTEPFYNGKYVFVTKQNKPKIKNVKELFNKIIATPKGWSRTKFLQEYFPKIKLLLTDTMDEAYQAVKQNKAYSTLEFDAVVNYFLKKHMNTNFKINAEFDELNEVDHEFHYLIRKDWPLLVSIFNKAYSSITIEEINSIQRKWFLENEIKEQDITFTNKQKSYLKTKSGFTMCINPDWMPFSDFNGEKTKGMVSSYIDIISSAIDKKIIVPKVQNWNESLQMIKEGRCDIISFLKNTEKRKEYLNFTKPITSTSIVVASSKQSFFIDDFGIIKDKTFAVVEGAFINQKIKEEYPNIKLIFVKNIKEGLEKVFEEKVYGFIGLSASIAYTIEKYRFHTVKIINKLNTSTQLSFGVQKDDDILFSIINKIINSVSEEQTREIYNKQVFMQKEQIVDYSLVYKVIFGSIVIILLLWLRNNEISKHNSKLKEKNKLLKEAQQEIEEKNKKLKILSTTDRLTGINNRAKIDEILKSEIKRSNRYNNNFAFAILDIDHFKMVNDNFGHQVGDEVLIEIAKVLKDNVREIDSVGRWGGEEFVMILPETNKENALMVCENIRKIIESHPFSVVGNKTTSIGLSEYIKNDNVETIVKRADDALYEAKKTGRNKVITNYT